MDDLEQKLAALSPAQRALFELRRKKLEQRKKPEPPRIVRRPVAGSAPLSLDQERLWFVNQFAPDGAAYNIHTGTRLMGPLDVALLEKSVNLAIERHEVLRTTFIVENNEPRQLIAPCRTAAMPVVDIQHLSTAQQEAYIESQAVQEALKPFDLSQGPLLRVWLLKMSPTAHIMFLNQHHIITDWWSSQLLFEEIGRIYDALVVSETPKLPEVAFQYTDFVLWERERLAVQDMEPSLNYWRYHLAGGTFRLDLPIAHRRPLEQTYPGRNQPLHFSPELIAGLRALSQRENATLFMTLTAGFKLLLFRYTGQTDITLGTPLANRSRPELQGMLGFLITMLVLHTEISGEITFSELLHRLRRVLLDAYAHQDVPFTKLLEVAQLDRDWSRNPLFQFSFIFLSEEGAAEGLKSLEMIPLEYDSQSSRFDMTLVVEDHNDEVINYIEYNTDLFTAESMARLAGHFRTLMESVVAQPDQPIAELLMLTPAERQQLLVTWNDDQHPYPADSCIHQLFEAQAERTPEAMAAVCGRDQLTYAALNRRARQLASQLRALGVGPDVMVGLCVERSLDMVAGLLAILKAGGAYVALDPAYPKARQAFMLQDARVTILLTQSHLVDTLPTEGLTVIDLGTGTPAEPTAVAAVSVASDNLAYILYTSGSTGQPKGVAIEHRSAVALLSWAKTVFSSQELAGVLASTSICFDLSVFEIFLPLSCGGTVIVAENALSLPTLPAEPPVTLINTVPSAMRELVRLHGVPSSVRVVNLAGEPLPNALVQDVYQLNHVEKVYNLYGPSEDTTYSTFVLTEKGATQNPTIGCPIANTQAYILDDHMQPVPIEVPGELYLGGTGLARGYLHRPDLTAERFIENPFGHGRLYKTGDLARYLPDGHIEFLGRRDAQVKLRGFRIELGEIETVLGQDAAVHETAVVVREDQPDDPRLTAYVVPDGEASVSPEPDHLVSSLRHRLRQKLPDYMVPSAFVLLDSLPMTPNGKIDRRALPAPDGTVTDDHYAAPSTPTEETLAAIWADILSVPRVSRHDDFFELGGHSLLATQIMLRVGQTFGIDLPLRHVLTHSTVAALADLIDMTLQTLTGLQDVSSATGSDREEVVF